MFGRQRAVRQRFSADVSLGSVCCFELAVNRAAFPTLPGGIEVFGVVQAFQCFFAVEKDEHVPADTASRSHSSCPSSFWGFA